jgi:hypothetical protein
MQAQRARCREAVDSYESEGALVSLFIRTDELSLDKARVCVKAILALRAGFSIRARSAELEIYLAYDTVEISYCRWIPSFWMGAQRVS